MKLSVKPINCRQCPSCYESKIQQRPWDIGKVMARLRKNTKENKKIANGNKKNFLKEAPSLHGGEPLLLPFDDIAKILKYSFINYKRSGIQTNLMHLTPEHIELFKKYNTSVGISLDGITAGNNQCRFPSGMPESDIAAATLKIKEYMGLLSENDISMSSITVLRKINCSQENIKDMIDLAQEHKMDSMRFNPGIIYDEKRKESEEITREQLFDVLKVLYDNLTEGLIISPVNGYIDGMMGHTGNISCGHRRCDPWSSIAEITLMGDGELGTCLHGAGALDGLQIKRGNRQSFARNNVLQQIPQEFNGCKDCKFWFMCYGGCPGSGIDNDFRNRTRFCEGIRDFLQYLYDKLKLIFPNIYLTPDFYPNPPDIKYIELSISGSVYLKQHRKSKPKTGKDTSKEYTSIIMPGGITHDDSNDQAWLKLNPNWGKKNSGKKVINGRRNGKRTVGRVLHKECYRELK